MSIRTLFAAYRAADNEYDRLVALNAIVRTRQFYCYCKSNDIKTDAGTHLNMKKFITDTGRKWDSTHDEEYWNQQLDAHESGDGGADFEAHCAIESYLENTTAKQRALHALRDNKPMAYWRSKLLERWESFGSYCERVYRPPVKKTTTATATATTEVRKGPTRDLGAFKKPVKCGAGVSAADDDAW